MQQSLTEMGQGALRGELRVPGDKSISHRALLVAAANDRPTRIVNLNLGRDVRATAQALVALGAQVRHDAEETIVCGGRLVDPASTIDCMNSGSTARMLAGLCAGANLHATLDGDASLRARPMEPVAAQLRAFGARIETTSGRLPLRIEGTATPQTRNFILLSPSAQVKSALLLAGLYARVPISITGDRGSRDHTERLLASLGATIEYDAHQTTLREPPRFRDAPIEIPGDLSSAGSAIVAATVSPGSEIIVRDVGVNPTRTGLLEVLVRMGASIEQRNLRELGGEPVADLLVRYAPLHGAVVDPALALRAVDEILLLAVAAAFAEGSTRITGIGDLRMKESDRIAAIEQLLDAVGIAYETLRDGIVVHGGRPRSREGVILTRGDHRTAMAAAALAAGAGPLRVDDPDCIDVSFPGFLERWRTLLPR